MLILSDHLLQLPLDPWLLELETPLPVLALGVSLHVLKLSCGIVFWLRRELDDSVSQTDCPHNVQLFYYEDIQRLRIDLMENAGGPSAYEVTHRKNWHEMLVMENVFNPYHLDSHRLLPLLQDERNEEFLRPS